MNKKAMAIAISVVLLVLTVAGVLLGVYWDSIKNAINGTVTYTYEDVQNAYNQGLSDGVANEASLLKQIEDYKNQVEQLQIDLDHYKELYEDLADSKPELEEQIKQLQLQVEQLKATIKYYEDLIENEEDQNIVFVSFYLEDTPIKSVAVKIGSIVPITEIPNIENTENAIFNGWMYENVLVDLNSLVIEDSIDLKASFTYIYTVTFYADEVNGNVIDTQNIEKGKYATLPLSPQKDGYIFKGWAVNNNIIDVISYPINEDTNFIAVFENTNMIIYKDINGNQYEIKSSDVYFYWKTFNCPVDKSTIVYIELPSCFDRVKLGQFFENLEQIILPESINTLDDYCFGDCTKLNTIVLPESIQTVGRKIFKDCSSLTKIVIKNPDLYLNEYPFEGCNSELIIEYYGNMEQWNSKGYDSLFDLNDNIHANKITIQCVDGQIDYE